VLFLLIVIWTFGIIAFYSFFIEASYEIKNVLNCIGFNCTLEYLLFFFLEWSTDFNFNLSVYFLRGLYQYDFLFSCLLTPYKSISFIPMYFGFLLLTYTYKAVANSFKLIWDLAGDLSKLSAKFSNLTNISPLALGNSLYVTVLGRFNSYLF
jgi:hypothetical protein